MNFTTSNHKKVEELIREFGYELRYEKGHFNSGYCVLETKKIVVINKYFTQEVRFQKLLEILPSLELDSSLIKTDVSRRTYDKLINSPLFTKEIPFETFE